MGRNATQYYHEEELIRIEMPLIVTIRGEMALNAVSGANFHSGTIARKCHTMLPLGQTGTHSYHWGEFALNANIGTTCHSG